MLHDIGKIELPLRLRHREDNFSPSEARVYEEHVETGLVQAQRMGLSAGATAVIAQHHEHADGSGFPAGLNSDRMTMAARIVALVNRYDNLCNPRLPARAHDAARGAVAAVRPGPEQVRHLDPRRLHQDDGRLPAGLDGAAHRRPLRAASSPSTRRGR